MGRDLTVKNEGTVIEGAAGSIDFVGASVAAALTQDTHDIVVTIAGTVRFAAGVPSGAPTASQLPIAFDSTAVTGGVYYWTGSAWVKGGTI